MTPEQIRNFAYVSEGLENRIKSAADTAGTYEELVKAYAPKIHQNQSAKNPDGHTYGSNLEGFGHAKPF